MKWNALGAIAEITADEMSMKKLLVVGFCLLASSAYGSDGVSEAVAKYLEDFNRGVTASKLVDVHWHSPSALFTPDGVVIFETRGDSESWLDGLRAQITEEGWIRSEILDSTVCPLGDALALYSMKFKRVFSDRSESTEGGTYTLIKTDKWRIASVTLTNPNKLVRCD